MASSITSRLIVSLTDHVSGPARTVGGALARLQRQGDRTSGFLLGRGTGALGGSVRGLLAIGAGYVGVSKAIGGTVGAAIRFEESFADVRKVVDGTPAQLAVVRSEILDLSKRLPVTAQGIAEIYAAAGQSGVALAELGKFSEMAAKVSVAWDTSQSETGEALAKIKTQLQMNVDELGRHADAVNHLANNTAAAASDLVDFDKRVAAVGKMFGFTDTQTLAFGSSMISAGAQSEVAATSFRNMGRALTIGARATKQQRTAFRTLGLDAVKTAKRMQKDALATTLDVFDRLGALPKWQQSSIASALFGDEARALMPIVADTRELRRQLEMVGREANYSGSAFQEYLTRAETASNALQLIGNKLRGVGIGIGDGWLPTIKQAGLGLGDVLDTLQQRVGVLDEIKFAFQGFVGGIGYGGEAGVREAINDLGDLLFGKAFLGQARDADERVMALAGISNRFRAIGEDLNAFSDSVVGGDIAGAMTSIGSALSQMSGGMTVAGALAIGIVGRSLLALSGGVIALALSPIGRIAIVATAVASLIEAAKGAQSIGEFVDNMGELSTIDWIAIAAGVGFVGAKLWSVARALRLIKGAGGVAAAVGGAAAGASAAAGAGAAGGVAGGAGAGAGAAAGGGIAAAWARMISSGAARSLVRTVGLPALVGEVATRALLDTKPADPRLADPLMAPWIYRQVEDRNAGRAQELQQAAPPPPVETVPFSFARVWRDLMQPIDGGVSEAKQKIADLETTLTAATATWPDAAQSGIRAYIDAIASGGGAAEGEAERIGAGIKDALSLTATPQVDASQLSRALDIARQLGAAVRAAGSTRADVPALAIDGARAKGGPVRKGGRYLVGEDGPELLDVGEAGYVHDSRSTGAMMRALMRRGSPVSSRPMAPPVSVPSISSRRPSPAPAPAVQDVRVTNPTAAPGPVINVTVHAPGGDPRAIADAAVAAISARLNALSRGAYSDGAN